MAIRSRATRERERRRKAKKNRTQLLGATQQGQKRPMQQGYTTTSVKPPPFRESTAGADIMQAGRAYKGAKGLHDFATGTKGHFDKATGKWIEGTEPWSIGGEKISDKLGNYFEETVGGIGRRGDEAIEGAKSLFGTPQPSPSELAQLERANVGFNQGLLGPTPPPNLADEATRVTTMMNAPTTPSQLGTGAGEGMTFLQGARTSGMPTSSLSGLNTPMPQLTAPGGGFGGGPLGAATAGSNLLSGAGLDYSNLLSGAGAGTSSLGSLGGTSSLGGFQSGGDLGSLFSNTGGGGPAGTGWMPEGINMGGSSFGTVDPVSGSLSGGVDPSSGLQSGGGHPWLSYANIGKDLFMGGPQSEKVTGSTLGDAAIRLPLAYLTGGFSEIPWAFF